MNRFIIIRSMPQVSKRPLPKDIENKIYQSFIESIKLLNRDEEISRFLNDLLTQTEKVMIPKRLAIAILLSKGWTSEMIQSSLNVTQTTVASVAKSFGLSSGYKMVIEKLKKTETSRLFWQDIENLLYRLSAPGRVFLDEEIVKHKLGSGKKTLV